MAHNRRPPQIFLSSTIRDLKVQRAGIARDVEARGWTAWLWEHQNEAGGVERQIQTAMKRSDFVLCVLGSRYGSLFQTHNVSVTEWELGLARRLHKPLAIYWIRAPEHHPAQDSLCRLLEETDDLRIAVVGLRGLRRAVSSDLDGWEVGGYRPPRFFASKLLPRQSPESHPEARPIGVDEARDKLTVVRSLRDRELYLDAERELSCLKPLLRGFGSPRAARDKLSVARDFFDLGANINHVRGIPTAARANALAAIQVGWHLQDPAARVRSASAASGIYSRDPSRVALAANDYARDRTTDSGELAGVLDARAAILLNQGDVTNAAKLSKEAVLLHEGADNLLGYLHTRLATTLRATNQPREWDAVDEAFAAAGPLVRRHPLSQVMLDAAEIPHLIEAHREYAQAADLFSRAVSDCEYFGLRDPMLGLAKLGARYGL